MRRSPRDARDLPISRPCAHGREAAHRRAVGARPVGAGAIAASTQAPPRRWNLTRPTELYCHREDIRSVAEGRDANG